MFLYLISLYMCMLQQSDYIIFTREGVEAYLSRPIDEIILNTQDTQYNWNFGKRFI